MNSRSISHLETYPQCFAGGACIFISSNIYVLKSLSQILGHERRCACSALASVLAVALFIRDISTDSQLDIWQYEMKCTKYIKYMTSTCMHDFIKWHAPVIWHAHRTIRVKVRVSPAHSFTLLPAKRLTNECQISTCTRAQRVYLTVMDCTRCALQTYYHCTAEGRKYQYRCGGGTVFNVNTLVCDHIHKVSCDKFGAEETWILCRGGVMTDVTIIAWLVSSWLFRHFSKHRTRMVIGQISCVLAR